MRYSGRNLDECLMMAAKDLDTEKCKLRYTVKKDSKKFFHKYCEIEVLDRDNDENDENDENKGKIKEEKMVEIVEDIVKFKFSGTRELILEYSEEEVDVFVNGNLAENKAIVNCTNEIRVKGKGEIINGSREINIETNPLEAMVTTTYIPGIIEVVKCEIKSDTLRIFVKKEEVEDVKPYTKDEILKVLSDNKISYGIDMDAVEKATVMDGVSNLVVARGIPPVDDEPDRIEVYFESLRSNLGNDKEGRVDYRNATSITNVKSGEELGELVEGESGKDGIDIYGMVAKRKLKKCLQLKVGTGCKIKENKVVSIIEGQPSVKKGVFYVHKVFEVHEDVDIKSGNINFIGDVKVGKSVRDGMKVESGNSVTVLGNVEAASIIAHGESVIEGSVINSTIKIGDQDIMNEKKLEDIKAFLKELELLLESVNEIKERHLFEKKSDGELIKALIDSKFRHFTKKAMAVMNHYGEENFDNIKNIIRTKLIGLGPLSVKFANDLYKLKEWIEDEIKPLEDSLVIPVDIHLGYVQDSEISATGNVYLEGKGQYTSTITALGDIVFKKENAVSRGGQINAKGNVIAKELGSAAGISTIVKVSKESTITADIAYNNTVFYFGERRYVFELPAKDIKAYVDDKGEIIVEKFVL